VAVLVCDLDGLKIVNDHLGHRRGDELLVAIAERIRAAARKGDLVARTGGDEFVVVCPAVSASGAQAIAERIRASAAAPIRLDDYEIRTSLSVGIAVSDALSDTVELLDRADADMYRIKEAQSGRRTLRAHPARSDSRTGAQPVGLVIDLVAGDGPATHVRLVESGAR
jgi:diguanylate cyclase (GGDEF)-like protein